MPLLSIMLVYKEGASGSTPRLRDDASFRRLSRAECTSSIGIPEDVVLRQTDRLIRFGDSYCYGAFVDGSLAAFAWLIPHDKMQHDVPHILAGNVGEAEITAAETLPQFRGRSLHGFVIDNCIAAAAEIGIHSVYFKTFPANEAARKSFLKNGYRFVGNSYILKVPGFRGPFVWPRRFR